MLSKTHLLIHTTGYILQNKVACCQAAPRLFQYLCLRLSILLLVFQLTWAYVYADNNPYQICFLLYWDNGCLLLSCLPIGSYKNMSAFKITYKKFSNE